MKLDLTFCTAPMSYFELQMLFCDYKPTGTRRIEPNDVLTVLLNVPVGEADILKGTVLNCLMLNEGLGAPEPGLPAPYQPTTAEARLTQLQSPEIHFEHSRDLLCSVITSTA